MTGIADHGLAERRADRPAEALAQAALQARLVLCLMGPTATGKSGAAMTLAERLPVSLISVDSVMVYRGLDIGSAKPDPDLLRRYPHALIDIRDPSEPFSVAEFLDAAEASIAEAFAAGRLPVLVGGTMLYFSALQSGMARMPAADERLRRELGRRLRSQGSAALHAELAAADPEAAARIHPNNPQRLLRALEVYQRTGRPISQHWAEQGEAGPAARNGWRLAAVALEPDRQALLERIERRFGEMLRRGLVEEVAGLRARGDLSPELPALRAVGYRQVWNYLEGVYSHQEMVLQAIAATRRLARRQLTWMRGTRWPRLTRLPASERDVCGAILKYLEAVAIVP